MPPEQIELVSKIVETGIYGTVAIAICLTIVLVTLYLKSGDPSDLHKVFNFKDLSVLVTIVAIIFSIVVLSFGGLIQGESVVAILSGIAGYVLGGFNRLGKGATNSDDN